VTFKDLFSRQASAYARLRPSSPPPLCSPESECGHRFQALGESSAAATAHVGMPNLRGPTLLTKIGVGILGYLGGCLPLAILEQILEVAGRPVGPSYKGAYFPLGIFGAWFALRLLKRTPGKQEAGSR